MAMVRTQIYLPKETHQRLRSLSRTKNQPMAKLIRSYMEDNLKPARRRESSLDVLLKVAGPGPRNLSEHHDRYLYGKRSSKR